MSYFRYAIRNCAAQPGFSITVLLTIGLTVGAAAAVFSLLDAVLLRPFPYKDPQRLVRIESYHVGNPKSTLGVSLYDFKDYRSRNRTLENVAAYFTWSNPLTGMGPARSVRMTFASAGFFDIMGAKPQIGRTFSREEDVYGGPVLKVVLGYSLWQDLFSGRNDALGKTVHLRGQAYEVIGVMPPAFDFPNRTLAWVPLMARYSAYKDGWWKRRYIRPHETIARLQPGISVEQAEADVAAVAATLRTEHPQENREMHARLLSLHEAETGEVKPYVGLVAGAALLLLALGCVNVANLMVARAVSREREVAVRMALGSGTAPLIAQLAAEAILLSLPGAALGILLAYVSVNAFRSILPASVPSWLQLMVDVRVVAFAACASIVTALIAILLPMAQQVRANVTDVLKHGARGSSGGRTFASSARRALVVIEVALSFVILAGAGLMIRSLERVMALDPGLRTENLVVIESGRYIPNVERRAALAAYCDVYRRIQVALQETPGVIAASGSHAIPFVRQGEQRPTSELYTLRRATRDQAFRLPTQGADVMPGYFATAGIPLLDGRDFTENDSIDNPTVVVVSQRTAETLFPGDRAVGQKVRFDLNDSTESWSTIVGVVGNTRFNAAERVPGYEVYWSYLQYPNPGISYIIRTAADPAAMKQRLSQIVQQADPDTSIERVSTIESLMQESVWRRRLWSFVLSAFGILALVLAVVGLYGVISYLVAQQRRDIGIRLAIGAAPRWVLQWVLQRGMYLAGIGTIAGLIGASGAVLLVSEDLLFGITRWDSTTYLAACGVMFAVAVAACLIPAVRASRVDPAIALREE